MKTGFIGLGNLGKTMAKRLISEGVEPVVWNRTREKAEDLDVEIADTPADLFSKTDIIFLNLFDSDAVDSVLTGTDGFLECGSKEGKIIVDTTTNHFESVEHFHDILEENGASYLEAPVLGSVVPASQGTLTVLVSGKKEAYEKVLPYLEKIGKKIFHFEARTLATRMKLINNLVLGSLMGVIAEALSLAEDVGVKKEEALDILSNGAGNSMVLNAKKAKLLNEDFSSHFSVSLIYKDLHYLQDLAKSLTRPVFTASVKELYAMASAMGMADDDFSAVYRALKELPKR